MRVDRVRVMIGRASALEWGQHTCRARPGGGGGW